MIERKYRSSAVEISALHSDSVAEAHVRDGIQLVEMTAPGCDQGHGEPPHGLGRHLPTLHLLQHSALRGIPAHAAELVVTWTAPG